MEQQARAGGAPRACYNSVPSTAPLRRARRLRRSGLHACHDGDMPPALQPLTALTVQITHTMQRLGRLG
jgi:hypothetical protein